MTSRHIRCRFPLGVTLISLCLVLFNAAISAGGQTRQAPLGGINIGGVSAGESLTRIDAEVAAAHSLHARLIRVEMPWAQFQPTSATSFAQRTITASDRLVEDAAKDHIGVIALVDRTPCWASTAPALVMSACVPGRSIGQAYAWPPREAAAFGAFTGWLAKRYGNNLAAIEVWNEPDQSNQHFLAGPEKPAQYAKLLRAAYPAIKQADSQITVLAGSLVGSNGTFLNALYAAGIGGYYDGISVHFYNLTLGSLRAFREVQLAHHDRTPLWLDEFGWTSCWPARNVEQEQACVSQSVQAQNMASMIHELARTSYVAAAALYELQDSSNESFGVLSAAGKRKPSFYALAKALRSPFTAPAPVKLALSASHGRVIATGSGPVGDYMRLEAWVNGALRYYRIFTLNRFNDFKIALPSVLGTRHITVRVYQYWLGTGRAAKRSI